jgi:DNA-binding GntR family transcriptional regulator
VRHDKFHDYLCGISGMPRLVQQSKLLRHQTSPYIRLYVNTHPDPEPLGLEHRSLLAKILGGDEAQAEAVMRSHIVENGKSIVAFLEALPNRTATPRYPDSGMPDAPTPPAKHKSGMVSVRKA